ncbi:MAG: hypothetical protein ACOZBW_08940, partial [Thermodesulfobacteriota bacterium]
MTGAGRIYILITLFFTALFLFFFSSGLWHWVWFGRGREKAGQAIARRLAFFRRGENGVLSARRFVRTGTSLLVMLSAFALASIT